MDLLGARVVGPLESHAAGYAAHLEQRGYTFATRRNWMTLVAHLSRWLAGEGLGAAGLTGQVARRYVAARAAAGYRACRSSRSLDPLLSYLRDVQAAPAEPPAAVSAGDALVERFRAYLLAERGVKPDVAEFYVVSVRPFVSTVMVDDGVDAARLSARTVTAYLSGLTRSLAPKTVQGRASALRALLRFWFLDGVADTDLSVSVPKVAHRASGLPKGLPAEQVTALLASCDTHSVNGLRDRAILTMLARMGLRAGEVAGLQLDDLDWRQGEVVVRGKGGHRDRLPLPVDVGQALVDYLEAGRPAGALDRCVFVRVKAPRRGLTSIGVTQVVNAAGHRAGLGTVYAHRLRHSAATAMLAAGAPLTEIGQVLRHRSVLTTAIYAKVDIAALRSLAMPWPQEVTR
ncbi:MULTISPECIES: tyrosine-type recombinase/integrase [unclassified Micromonospora]|uniref:tyrosine-type recombinase/integrase n=1 Tax=unclassified Micromonospora TaxID=2617518 RepID=UPI003A876F2A